jgi:hypothetical protein
MRSVVEIFVLGVLVAAFVNIFTNSMQLTNWERVLAVNIIISVVLWAGIHLDKKKPVAPLPKPVLHWQGYTGHPAITPEFFKVQTAEASSTLSLFLQNEGNANLTQGTLYIKYESGYEVIADKHWEPISMELEKEVRGISIGIPTIYPAPAEPFRFNLTINPRVGGSSVPNWAVTSVMKLYIKVDAAEIPNGLEFHELEVTHR